MENKIVYLGSEYKNATYVLEQEEESEQLKVVREDKGFDFERGYYNTASCVSKREIYAFKTKNYKEVHRYCLKSGSGGSSLSISDLSYSYYLEDSSLIREQ